MFVFRAAVVGAGVMGGEIAQVIAAADIPVLLKDVDQKFVDAGLEKAREVTEAQVGKLVYKGKLTPEQGEAQVERTLGLITGTTSYEGFGDVDFVIEAVPEKMEIKHAVFAELDAATPGHAILASNTSVALDHGDRRRHQPPRPASSASTSSGPRRSCALIEVIEGEDTSPETVQIAANFAQAIKKMPIALRRGARLRRQPDPRPRRRQRGLARPGRERRSIPRRSTSTSGRPTSCRWGRSASPT